MSAPASLPTARPSVPARLRRAWKAWRADTLGTRLFLLLWGTLVFSHLLGFQLAHGDHGGPVGPPSPRGMAPDWLLPNLPPGGLFMSPPASPPGQHPGVWSSTSRAAPQSVDAARDTDDAGLPAVPYGEPLLGQGQAPFDGPWAMPPDHGPGGFGALRSRGPAVGPHPPRMWLEYLVRVLVMGLAAWLGSRWLTAPMRRLSGAARGLDAAIDGRGALPLLDETRGPREVREMAGVFNDMARGLRHQFEQRGLMMAAVSHDLRTPLTRLRMRLEALRPQPLAERCVEDVQDINAMIESVLDVMNETRRQEPLQAVDVLALVQAMADDAQELGQAVAASGEQATADVQPLALRRVLNNVVGNALRYGGEARIAVARAPQGHVCITVDDPGPGLPEDRLEAVFQPFYRLDAARTRTDGGMGLGLYIARELLRRLGGRIALHNRPEGGLRAEIRLPEAQTTTGSGSSRMPKRP